MASSALSHKTELPQYDNSEVLHKFFLSIFRYPGYMIGIPHFNGLNFEHFPLNTSLSLFTLKG